MVVDDQISSMTGHACIKDKKAAQKSIYSRYEQKSTFTASTNMIKILKNLNEVDQKKIWFQLHCIC